MACRRPTRAPGPPHCGPGQGSPSPPTPAPIWTLRRARPCSLCTRRCGRLLGALAPGSVRRWPRAVLHPTPRCCHLAAIRAKGESQVAPRPCYLPPSSRGRCARAAGKGRVRAGCPKRSIACLLQRVLPQRCEFSFPRLLVEVHVARTSALSGEAHHRNPHTPRVPNHTRHGPPRRTELTRSCARATAAARDSSYGG